MNTTWTDLGSHRAATVALTEQARDTETLVLNSFHHGVSALLFWREELAWFSDINFLRGDTVEAEETDEGLRFRIGTTDGRHHSVHLHGVTALAVVEAIGRMLDRALRSSRSGAAPGSSAASGSSQEHPFGGEAA